MNMISLFLAQRILLSSVYKKNISTMTMICFLGIFIGSFSLALITAITHGYEQAIHTKMQGINAQIILRASGQPLNIKALTSVLTKEFSEISAFSPTTMRHILMHTSDNEDTPTVGLIKAIDPQAESATSILSQKIIMPSSASLPHLIHDNYIIIGKQMARNNELSVGDTIDLLFTHNEKVQGRKITFDTQKAVVSGIFETGIDEVDSGVMYCTFSFLEMLFPDAEVEQINIQLQPGIDEMLIIKKLQDRLALDVNSWKDLYPALVSALKLEKYVTFFILALITLVASMNIISLLYMQITQKRPDIAILKAMGMSNQAISSIFFFIGMIISTVASSCGLLAAIVASWLLDRYPFIQLPDAYYVTTLPICMDWWIIVSVFCVVLLFSFCATWFPAQRIKSINISQVLRFEG